MMRPSSLRRFEIAAVACGLLLASGAVPGFASDVDKTEGTQTTRVTGGATHADAGSWIRTLLADGTRAIRPAAVRTVSWIQRLFVPAVTPQPVPLGVIVDDGAPF